MHLQFGKYLLFKRLAAGGMAEIFLARQLGAAGFEKLVVVKKILPDLSADGDFVRMFLDEAKLCASLSHPNVVQVFDLGEVDGNYFMAMEFVPGHDLNSVLKRGVALQIPMPPPLAARLIANACEGLHYAHTRTDLKGQPLHVVHRDISPGNLLLSYEGSVKVTDFGIAKAESQSTKTEAGKIKGKFSYMSPEQIRGDVLDARSDVFSLGITLHETLCGRRLFKRDNEMTIMRDILEGEVRAPSELRPDIPKALDAICLKALAKDVRKRYQSAREFSLELEKYLATLPSPPLSQHLGEHLVKLFSAEYTAYRAALTELPTAEPDKLSAIFSDPSGPGKSGSAFSRANLEAQGESAVKMPAKRTNVGLGAAIAAVVVAVAAVSLWFVTRPPPGPTSGLFQVESDPPGAHVWLDGVDTGFMTPTTLREVSFGVDHLVRLELEGREPWESSMRVDAVLPSKAVSTTLRALPGSLQIATVPPGATVFVDGQLQEGKSPVVIEGLPAASHVVHASLEGYADAEVVVKIAAGKREVSKLELKAVDGKTDAPTPNTPPSRGGRELTTVGLTTDPSCELFYEGRSLGKSPVVTSLPAGRQTVTCVNRALDLNASAQLDVPKGKGRLDKRLTFGMGRLATDITPWADVYLGDKKLGTTPFAPRELYEGKYTLRLVNSELGAIKTLSVTVQAGKTTVVRQSLE